MKITRIKNCLISSMLLAGVALVGVNCSSAPAPTGSGPGTGGAGGGLGGGGGSPAAGCPTTATAKLSDFTTVTGIESVEGRMGGWYFYGDPMGTFEPPKVDGVAPPIDTMGSPCSPGGSLRLKGTGFTGFGAGLGTNFVMPTGTFKNTYDASKYTGVTFYAKGAAMINHVQVKFLDWNTDPEIMTPRCMLGAPAVATNCSPYLVKFDDLGTPITTEWKQFRVAFADTTQDAFNSGFQPVPDMVDKAHLTSLQIQINANFGAAPPPTANNFEIWIDDVYFY